jgi:hypothetical protein
MNSTLPSHLKRTQTALLIVGGIALVGSFAGALSSAKQFFTSYLFSYLFWLGLALGCFTITMIHHLTGGRWGHPIRRFLEAGFSTLPLMALLFVPILFGLSELYPWARPDAVAAAEVLQKKQGYLNAPFFIGRFVFYFALWITMAWLLRKWSLEQDNTVDAVPSRRLLKLSGPGIVIFPLTATFAYVDWIMSMEAEWYSTIFAVIVLAGQVLVAYAFAVILLKIFERQEGLSGVVSKLHFHQLGNFLLTFVMFWTYVSFGQLLIIYSANTPREISWYLHRINGSWVYLVGVIALLHFFLPFFLLLFRAAKRHAAFLTGIASVIFGIHLVYAYWLVTPSMFGAGIHLNWLDFVTPVGIGGVWLGTFIWLLRRAPLVPRNDPRMREELAHAK